MIIAFRGQFQIAIKKDAVLRMADPGMDFCLFGQSEAEADLAGSQVLLEGGLDPQILSDGFRVEVDGPEDAGEPEKVLVLDPGAGAALIDLHAEPVAPGLDMGGQVKVRGGEGILRVAHKMAVEPDEAGLLHALEGDAHIPAKEPCVQVKFPDVGAHRVKVPVDLRRAQLRVAVPGVELIGVVDGVITLGLHVAGHGNGTKAGEVKILFPEVRGPGGWIPAPFKKPLAVQALAQGGGFLFGGGVGDMVGVGIQAIYPKNRGVFKPFDIRQHSRSLLICFFYHKYTKAKKFRQPR